MKGNRAEYQVKGCYKMIYSVRLPGCLNKIKIVNYTREIKSSLKWHYAPMRKNDMGKVEN